MTDPIALIGALAFALVAAIMAITTRDWSAHRMIVFVALALPIVFIVYRAVLGGGV